MLRNYFITAFRNLIRHKVFSFINLLGLTVGLGTTIFILLWIRDEMTYDHFQKDIDRIYSVMEHQTYSSQQIYTFSATPGLLAEALKAEFPEVEASARSNWGERALFRYEDKIFYSEGRFGDPSLLAMLTYTWLEGDALNPMPDESSVVINQSLAKKLFGDEPAYGKMIRFRNRDDLKVTAVYKDLPSNSSLQFEFVAHFHIYEKENTWLEHWGNNGLLTYVKLIPGADYKEFNKKIADYIKTKNEGSVVTLFLHPMKDLRLRSNFEKGELTGGRILYVRAFGAVAIFILVIACINFMNLTTARSAIRSREVGVRKVVGAGRVSLIGQFLGESVLITFLALVISVLMVYLLLPLFNELTLKKVVVDLFDPRVWFGLIIILFLTGILSGSYPAFILSSFRTVDVLKGQVRSAFRGVVFRKILVVVQYLLSVILIVSALVINKQIHYLQSKNLGFDRENIIYFSEQEGLKKNFESFRNEALSQTFIINVGTSNQLPYKVGSSTGDPVWDGKKEEEAILFQIVQVDQDFLGTLGFQLKEGRFFSREFSSDTLNFIVNEEAARRMGMENPIGVNLECWGRKGQIIGVVRDFHSQSLYSPIDPLIFVLWPEDTYITFLRIEAGKTEEAISFLEAAYKKNDPDFPFEYEFLDKSYQELYKTEMTIGSLADTFTGIAIFIACLGLFGLASFTVERMSKEISIRKVFGASSFWLIIYICRDFALLIAVAIVAGSPVAWYIMNKFLSQYAFHTNLGAGVFILTSAGIMLIAMITVGYQSLRATLVNPADTLRNE